MLPEKPQIKNALATSCANCHLQNLARRCATEAHAMFPNTSARIVPNTLYWVVCDEWVSGLLCCLASLRWVIWVERAKGSLCLAPNIGWFGLNE